jgi:hypothetical protein
MSKKGKKVLFINIRPLIIFKNSNSYLSYIYIYIKGAWVIYIKLHRELFFILIYRQVANLFIFDRKRGLGTLYFLSLM